MMTEAVERILKIVERRTMLTECLYTPGGMTGIDPLFVGMKWTVEIIKQYSTAI